MRVTLGPCVRIHNQAGMNAGTAPFIASHSKAASIGRRPLSPWLALTLLVAASIAIWPQDAARVSRTDRAQTPAVPPRVAQAQRFLARRGGTPNRGFAVRPQFRANEIA